MASKKSHPWRCSVFSDTRHTIRMPSPLKKHYALGIKLSFSTPRAFPAGTIRFTLKKLIKVENRKAIRFLNGSIHHRQSELNCPSAFFRWGIQARPNSSKVISLLLGLMYISSRVSFSRSIEYSILSMSSCSRLSSSVSC